MTPNEMAYHDHILRRPVTPGAVGPNSPAMIAFHQALQAWVDELAPLQDALTIERNPLPEDLRPVNIRMQPVAWHLDPKEDADERWSQQPPKRQRAPRPAWSGGGPGYYAQKAREYRQRKAS